MRHPATAILLSALAAHAPAQCFQFANDPPGARIAIADDGVRTIALPFSFPFHGVLYERVTLAANGFLWLGNPPSVDAGDFRDSPVPFLAGQPRIALCWDDWDTDDATSMGPADGVFYAADASQVSFVWKGVPRFGSPAVRANMECVLRPDGGIHLAFDASMGASTSSCLTGITRGNQAPPHAVDFAPATPAHVDDSTGFESFTMAAGANPFDLAGTALHFAPATPPAAGGPVRYLLTTAPWSPCAPSSHLPLAEASTAFGQGCPEPNASIYEAFSIATGPRRVDLAGASLRFARHGSRYTLGAGGGFDSTFALRGAPIATVADDSMHAFALARPFPFGGQLVTHVTLSSNGYLWLGNGSQATQQFNASRASFHSASLPRVAAFWKDLVPNAANAPVQVENSATRFLATWSGVPLFTGGGSHTFQIELDLATGDVSLHYAELTGLVSDAPPVCGLAPALATDLGPADLTASGVVGSVSARATGGGQPLGHSVSIDGARFSQDFVLRFANAPANHSGFGVFLVGDTQLAVSLDSIFGLGSAPDCWLYTNLLGDFPDYFGAGAPSGSYVLRVPFDAFLAGRRMQSQFGLLAPANPLSMLASNGATWTIGW